MSSSDESEPPSDLVAYAEEVKKRNYFIQDFNQLMPNFKNLLIKEGGRKKKRKSRKMLRRKSRRQKGGENPSGKSSSSVTKSSNNRDVSPSKSSITYSLVILLLVGIGIFSNGFAAFGKITEWMRTNPEFFYLNVFKMVFDNFSKEMSDIYKKTVTKQIVEVISKDVVGLNAFNNVHESVSDMIMGGTKTNKEEAIENIRTNVNIIATKALTTSYFSLQAGCFGTVTFQSNPSIQCSDKEE